MAPQSKVSYAAVTNVSNEDTFPQPKTNTSAQPSYPHDTTSQWRIARRVPIAMLVLFVSGILVSVGHHLFYSYLDSTTVRGAEEGASRYVTQIWIIRYGTAFAFLAKTLLASAVVVAYKQHIWTDLRGKAHNIATINTMFTATHDFLAALSPNFFTNATIPALLALVTWLLPLAALVTPSTLTVIPDIRPVTLMLPIPTLNLNNPSLYSFSGLGTGVSPLVTRIVSATASGMEILPMVAIAPNSTYEYNFTAPSLKCDAPTGEMIRCIDKIWNATAKDPSMVASAGGSLKYLAFSMSPQEMDSICQNGTLTTGYNETTFTSSCVIGRERCFSSSINRTISVRLSDEITTNCVMHNTRFSLNLTAAGGAQLISHMSYEFDLEASDSVSDQLAVAIADILNGAIGATMAGPAAHQFDNGGAFLASAHTRIMETALIGFVSTAFDGTFGGPLAELPMADRELTKNKTLPAALEELSRNVTLSLFSSDRLWSPNVTMANVTRSEYRTIYSYQPKNLLLAYGIAIATSAIGVLLGLRALWLNGVAHDTGYFSIMATTRNRFLDDLTVGNDLGAVPIPKHIQEERLRFGVIMDAGHNSDGRELRVGFGAERQLQSLKKDLR